MSRTQDLHHIDAQHAACQHAKRKLNPGSARFSGTNTVAEAPSEKAASKFTSQFYLAAMATSFFGTSRNLECAHHVVATESAT